MLSSICKQRLRRARNLLVMVPIKHIIFPGGGNLENDRSCGSVVCKFGGDDHMCMFHSKCDAFGKESYEVSLME